MAATPSAAARPRSPAEKPRAALVSVDVARIAGALSLFAYHYINDVRLQAGTEYATQGWLGFLGYFGVAVFITISGVVLGTPWERDGTYGAYLRRRLSTLFSLYWWIAIPLISAGLAVGMMPASELWKAPFWLLGLNVADPALFQPLVSAWWYMGLALQIVLVYPVAHRLVARLGPTGAMIAAAGIALASIAAIGLLPSRYGYLYDGFIGARMLELTFGAALGATLRNRVPVPKLAAPAAVYAAGSLAAIALVPAGATRVVAGVVAVTTVAALTLSETTVFARFPARAAGAAALLGSLAFAFYLVHPPVVRLAVGALPAAGALALALGVSGVAAWGFDSTHKRMLAARRRRRLA